MNFPKSLIRWGFIGGGNVVDSHSGPAFNRVSNSVVSAVMRRDKEKAKLSALKLGAEHWYDSVDDLLNDSGVDAIYIATPPGVHYEQALACCRANKPTYIEKPLARNFSESSAIVETFEKAGVPLFVAHYRRALPRFIELKSLIDKRTIGQIRDVHIRLTRRFKDDEKAPWLFNTEISGGGKFFDIAPHTIDLLVFLFGSFSTIHSVVKTTDEGKGLEDIVVFSFSTEGGVLGTCNFNLVSDVKGDEFNIYGSNGSISTTIHDDKPIIVNGKNGAHKIDIGNPEFIEESMIGEVVKFLLGKNAFPCFGRDALETYRIIDVILSEFYGGREDKFWTRISGK